MRLRIAACHACLEKVTREQIKQGIHVPIRSGYPLQTLSLDLTSRFNACSDGSQYVLVCQDGWSRFCQLYPLKDGKSVTINNVLMDNWIATFGCPAEIRSDQGSYFTSDEFRQWCKSLGIKQVLTPVRNPWSNTVERLIRTVNQLIRTNMASGETEWQLILPAAALAYNTKVNASTGVTPALAFLGHELAMPVDLALQQKRTAFPDVPSTVRSILNRYNRLYQLMAEKQEAVIRRNTRQYSGLVEFQVGETVWYMDHRPLR